MSEYMRRDRGAAHGRPGRATVVRRYVVLMAYRPDDWESASEADRQQHLDAHRAFEEYVDGHGRLLGCAALAGADTATTIRHRDGTAAVTDGPFVELVEQLGGYYDVEVRPTMDAEDLGR